MESLTDVASLRGEVAFREETRVVDPSAFAHFESIDGVAAVGVTRGDGILLWTDASHGWLLPAAPVEPGEDYAAVARRVAERLAGVAVEFDGPERVHRIDYRSDDRRTTCYHVLLSASTAAARPATDRTDSEDGDTKTRWFGEVPADVHSEEEAADVRRFLD